MSQYDFKNVNSLVLHVNNLEQNMKNCLGFYAIFACRKWQMIITDLPGGRCNYTVTLVQLFEITK